MPIPAAVPIITAVGSAIAGIISANNRTRNQPTSVQYGQPNPYSPNSGWGQHTWMDNTIMGIPMPIALVAGYLILKG